MQPLHQTCTISWVVTRLLSYFAKKCSRKLESRSHLAGADSLNSQVGRLSKAIYIMTRFVVVIKRAKHQELEPSIAFDPDKARAVKWRMYVREALPQLRGSAVS